MRNSRRGSFLALALFFTVIATTAALGLVEILPSESASLKMSRLDEDSTRAAEAGIRDCMAWMSRQLNIGNEPLSSPTLTRNGTSNGWDWAVTITADPNTPPHPRAGQRMYKLVSVASHSGTPRRRITAWIQGGETLAKYAFLNNAPDESGTWDLMVVPNVRTVDGPVHSEGMFKMIVVAGTMAGSIPPLNGKLTSSGVFPSSDGFQYYSGGGYEAPSSPEQYERLNVLGRSGFQAGVDPLPVPTSAGPLAEAAYGSTPPATPAMAVTVLPTGGTYVAGDVDDLQFSVVDGNQVMTIRQGADTTQVTRVYETSVGGASIGQRLVVRNGTPELVDGLGSGVFYSTGNVLAVSGKIRGKNTVAVDFSAGRSIEVAGNITRDDTVEGAIPTSNRDKLGLVASRILISDDPAKIPSSLSTHLLIYATMFADDQWIVESHNTRSPFRGSIFGGIQSRQKPPQDCVFSGGAIVAGMTGDSGNGTPRIVGDMNMENEPPPFYPASEKGKLVIRYWKEEPVV
jgi:hypothetical protein